MKTNKSFQLFAALALALCPVFAQAQVYYFATLPDDPLAQRNNTYAPGISGNDIAGFYTDSAGFNHGFVYDGATFTTLDDPLGSDGTYPNGISGNHIVGAYNDGTGFYGFFYDGTNYTTLSDPLSNLANGGTHAEGISSNYITGYYLDDSGGSHGFLYNMTTLQYTTLDDPSATASGGTQAYGISGNYVVGYYGDAAGSHGFLYAMSTSHYTTLNDPLSDESQGGTIASGVSGSLIAGNYYDSSGESHGFLYNMTTLNYTNLDDPLGANGTFPFGIDGGKIVGSYTDSNGNSHSFEAATTPFSISLPAITGISLSGTNLVLNASSGLSNRTYYTLMSTNVSLPLNQWTPAATNTLGADGNFTITATNAVDRSVPQRFYILQLQ